MLIDDDDVVVVGALLIKKVRSNLSYI